MHPRVILVKPPERSKFNFGAFSLGVLASAIRDIAKVSIVDVTDLAPEKAVEIISREQVDMIGVTVMGLSSVATVSDFIRKLRSGRQSATDGRLRASVVAGGHGATMMPEPLLDAGAAAVVLGEGERTFRDIVMEGFTPGMPGSACKRNGRMMIGPRRPLIRPLDLLPVPSRDLMPQPPAGIHLMETSRGCPHCCSFCETARFYGNHWRPHSPERVATEVRRLVEEYNAYIIHFADDNFTAGSRRVLRICEMLCQGPLPYLLLTSARADDLIAHPKLIPALASARIRRLTVGVETLEPDMSPITGKPISMDVYCEAFSRLRRNGIFSMGSFIVGLPGETQDMRMRMVELAVRAGSDAVQFLPFLPFPGIPIAGERQIFESDPEDVRDAAIFNETFYQHPAVLARLESAALEGDVRGTMANAILERRNCVTD